MLRADLAAQCQERFTFVSHGKPVLLRTVTRQHARRRVGTVALGLAADHRHVHFTQLADHRKRHFVVDIGNDRNQRSPSLAWNEIKKTARL